MWEGQAGLSSGMKTAISIPDSVFRKAEQYARRARKSRSQVYSEAVAEYLARRVPNAITETMNEVCDQLGDQRDDFVSAASRRTLRRGGARQAGRESWLAVLKECPVRPDDVLPRRRALPKRATQRT